VKYLQKSFSVAIGGNSNYEETFVLCHCSCHAALDDLTDEEYVARKVWKSLHEKVSCCRGCPNCGAHIKKGMEKQHDCPKASGS
jgi:hypothetical protein